MISFDASLLTAYYNSKLGITSSGTDGSGSTGGTMTPANKTLSPTGMADAPASPWGYSSNMAQESDLVTKVLGGHHFIDPNAVTSNVTGASPDYTKLFTLYQGLNALEGLAEKAQDKTLSALALTQVKHRFADGLAEVNSYIQDTKYDHISLTEGTLTDELKNTSGTARTNSTYTGPAIATGSATTSAKALEGDVQFDLSVKKIGTATPFQVHIDLSEMGTQTRSMSNVVSFINAKLKDQGLSTRFSVNRIPAVPETTTVNGKTVTTSKGVDSFGFQIKGVSFEDVTFSAPKTQDSVYVVQTTGDPDKKTTVKADDGTKTTTVGAGVSTSLLKFQADTSGGDAVAPADALAAPVSKVGDKYWVAGEESQDALPPTVNNVRATQAGPDGSLYVLADIDGTTSDQTIKGSQDVALIKYDSAGKVVFTRTLGASDSASGYAMTVGSDGKVAIAGTVTGALDISQTSTQVIGTGVNAITKTTTTNLGTNGVDPNVADSFVTVFDAGGVEQWTQRRGSTADDQATSVAFGDDGSVYVGGRTQSVLSGVKNTPSAGGYDGYLMGFTADGKATFTVQTGTSATDATSAVAVDNGKVYATSIENGNVIVRAYTPTSTTTTDSKGKSITTYGATVSAARDLGGIGGGSVSAMAIQDGKIYIGGSTGSNKLLDGTNTSPSTYSGSQDAFALQVDEDLSTTADDKVSYYGGAGVEKDAKVQFSGGKAWISGATTGDIAGTTRIATAAKTQDGYLARLDVATGAVEYQTRFSGTDGVVKADSIAVSQNSSSVLDRLGLPMGTIMQKDLTTDAKGKLEATSRIVSGTSVRAGDQFYMVDPDTGIKKTITIDANETMESLATKITRASSYKLKVDVTKALGKPMSVLDIKPANASSKMEFVAGPAGRDALAGLGLAAGVVTSDANKTMDAASTGYLTSQKGLGLSFDANLNLNSDSNIKDAMTSLQAVMKNVQKAYNYLKYGDPQPSTGTKTGNTSGTAPAYLTSQIANYQAGLNRLLGTG